MELCDPDQISQGTCIRDGWVIGFSYTPFDGMVSDPPRLSLAALEELLVPDPPFSDVGPDHPFLREIAWLKGAGLTNGYLDGSFHPTDELTRQAMAALLYRQAGNPDGAEPTCTDRPFTDVDTTDTFCGEITWMKRTGLTNGYLDGSFHPAEELTRQAMATFLHRSRP